MVVAVHTRGQLARHLARRPAPANLLPNATNKRGGIRSLARWAEMAQQPFTTAASPAHFLPAVAAVRMPALPREIQTTPPLSSIQSILSGLILSTPCVLGCTVDDDGG